MGAGDVLSDLLKADKVPRFRLTKIFRQAEASSIIRFAHEINSGAMPRIVSPVFNPDAWSQGTDCLFVDADEATQDQVHFIKRARQAIQRTESERAQHLLKLGDDWAGRLLMSADGVEVDKLYRPPAASEMRRERLA